MSSVVGVGRLQKAARHAMNVSTLVMYMDILDRMEDLLPCRQERRLKAVLNEARIHLLTVEPEELQAIWQEFR